MIVILLFLAVIAAIVGWWLSQQRLMAKPWLEVGEVGDIGATGASSLPTVKIGLGVFLAVAGSLFALFISAYSMRMEIGDWTPLPLPRLLWINTGVLVLSSGAMQWAYHSARQDRIDGVRTGLVGGSVFAFAFLAGQLLAWRQLIDAGYFLTTNPANAFFYLLTAVHGLHLLGGLAALGRTIDRVWCGGVAMGQVRLSVELCAIYWHFLLLVWLVLLLFLSLQPDETFAQFIIRCLH